MNTDKSNFLAPDHQHSSPSDTTRNNSGESGLTRRSALVLIAGAAGAVALRLHTTRNDEGQKRDSGDVLVDPDKFREFVGNFQEVSERLAEDGARPIPYEVFLAVGMHESDSGTSLLANEANNMHGIVAKDGWEGQIFEKPTEESVQEATVGQLATEHGDKLKILHTNQDGTVRVMYPRPFRKYESPEDSFADFQNKLYFKNPDGSYRYADVIQYLIQEGGRDPFKVVELMSDLDEEGEARYATGSEWLGGVKNYISMVQGITGNKSVDSGSGPNEPNLPPEQGKIDIDAIDFNGLNQPRDEELINRMKEAMARLDLDSYRTFLETGTLKKWGEVEEIVGKENYRKWYDSDSIVPEYLVLHLWANGVKNGDTGTQEKGPKGSSHKIKIKDQIISWRDNSRASTQFMLGGNTEDGDLWQLSKNPATMTGSVRAGIQDEGARGRENVGNRNTIAIEVQADSIYQVSTAQFEKIILWATQQLLEQGIIDDGITREKSDEIINHALIGHGKNSGIEFGYRYTRPLVQAVQQFVFIAIQN